MTKNVLNLLLASLNFAIEVLTIVDNIKPRVALISFLELVILIDGFLNRFVSRLVVHSSIELFSSLSSSNQVDNSVVPVVSQLDSVGAQIIKESLPVFFIHVGASIK